MKTDPDAPKPWETLTQKTVLENPWFTIRKQHMRTPDGAETDYYIHDAADAVLCVCVSGNKVLVERQYRPPVAKVSVDYPAGRAEKSDADMAAAIRRELHEETGFTARSLRQLAALEKDPGFSSARMHVFLAEGSVNTKATPDSTEHIQAQFVSPDEVLKMISTGEMACAFCISATFLAFKELEWLKVNLP